MNENIELIRSYAYNKYGIDDRGWNKFLDSLSEDCFDSLVYELGYQIGKREIKDKIKSVLCQD